MAIKSKEFIKALGLLKVALWYIRSLPNKRVNDTQYGDSYTLANEIDNLIRRNEN